MSAHGPMPRSAWIFPVLAVLLFAGATAFRFVPIRWLMRDRFHSDERIVRVVAPLLIMHGAQDSTIAILFGERLFELAREPKRFVRFAEAGHNDLDRHGAIEAVRQFIGAPRR